MSTDPDIESDQQAGCLHPRERYDLFGHDAAEQSFATAWSSGRLHHAWLITGPRGVGKASFAWRAARRVLGAQAMPESGPLGANPQDPVCRQIEAQACPDLLVLRRPWDEKRKRWRAEITVEEVRKAPHFFEMSASGGGWRVCIVDSTDDMNVNSANALLKTLEEPPARGVLFLIAHSPGRLPATIRSRCRRLDLRAPEASATAEWLMNTGSLADRGQAERASALAHHAPGRALTLAVAGGIEIADQVAALVAGAARINDADSRAVADKVTGRNSDGIRSLFFESLGDNLRLQARGAADHQRDPAPWITAWSEINTLVRDADALYLDPKQTVLTALSHLRLAARLDRA